MSTTQTKKANATHPAKHSGSAPTTTTGSAKTRPITRHPAWQSEACPAWCTSKPHKDEDRYDDRYHFRSVENVALTMIDSVGEYAGNHYCHPAELRMSWQQHYRNAEPYLELEVPVVTRKDPHTEVDETFACLTVAEARAVRDNLSQLLAVYDPAREVQAVNDYLSQLLDLVQHRVSSLRVR